MTKKYTEEQIRYIKKYLETRSNTRGDKQHALDLRVILTNLGLGGMLNTFDDKRKEPEETREAYLNELETATVETKVAPKSPRRDNEQANTEHSHHSPDSKVKEPKKTLAKEPEVKEKTKEEVAIQQLVGAFNSKGSKEEVRMKSLLRNIPAISDDNLKIMFKLDNNLSKSDMKEVRDTFKKDQSFLSSVAKGFDNITRNVHPQLANDKADLAIDNMLNAIEKGAKIPNPLSR